MTANGESELSTPSTGPVKRKKFSFGNKDGAKKVRSIELEDDCPVTKVKGIATPVKADAPASSAPKSGSIANFFARKAEAAKAAPSKPTTLVVDAEDAGSVPVVQQYQPPAPQVPATSTSAVQKPLLPVATSISATKAEPSAPKAGTVAPAAAAQAPSVPHVTATRTPTSTPAPNPGKLSLQGMVFVFTGELEQMARAEVEEKVKIAGGKVTGSVSGNTTYLVVGSRLDDGRPVEETSKYRKYMELKEKGAKKCPKLLNEEELLTMLGQNKPAEAVVNNNIMADTVGTSTSSTTSQIEPLPVTSQPHAVPSQPNPSMGEAGARLGRIQDPHFTDDMLPWVDLHAPKNFNELIGNGSQVKKLCEWLRDWESVVLKGQTKKAPFKHGGMPENVNARAALISGPPGIGKTTTVRLIASQYPKYELLEFNASDARGQKIIQSMADGIADNRTINFARRGAEPARPQTVSEITKKALIVMDEVDGMGAGDRGGNAALIKMIKKTRNPIICICNDAQSQKMRSLAYSCYDIKFIRPTKAAIAQRAMAISKHHGIPVEPNAAEMLAESCGNDIRMIINQLQAMSNSERCKQDKGITYEGAKDKMTGCKDVQVMLTPFDACKKLLISSEGSRMSLMDRCDMFFLDYSLVPLLVQENYLKSVEKKQDPQLMQRIAFSSELFVSGDTLSNSMRAENDWSLLPDMAITSTVYPAFITNGFVAFPQFPQFLGKYSTCTKTRRLSQELHAHLRLSTTSTRRAMLTSGYVDLLYKKTMHPLLESATDGIDETMKVIDAYGLTKDHIVEHLPELRLHLGQEDKFKLVDSKVKSAMTREFNQGNHAAKVVLPTSKKRKTGGADDNMDPMDEDDDRAKAANEDEEEAKSDDDAGGNMVKAKKGKGGTKPKAEGKAKSKARSKAKASSSSSGGF